MANAARQLNLIATQLTLNFYLAIVFACERDREGESESEREREVPLGSIVFGLKVRDV